MVAVDATILLLIVNPTAGTPLDPNGKPIEFVKERIDHLIDELHRLGTTILIPTPALAEVLVRAPASDAQRILDELQKLKVFRIEPFDTRAAIEVSRITREALGSKRAKKRADGETWAKIKYDWQIIAIAKVNSASAIYSDDEGLKKRATSAGIECIALADMPLPPANAQLDLLEGTDLEDSELE